MFQIEDRITGFALFLIIVSVMGCKVHNKMFSTENDVLVDSIQKQINHSERNYVIQKNDYLNIRIFTNRGEKIIDPNLEISKGSVGVGAKDESLKYLVRVDGNANLPMVGDVHLAGLTLIQADSLLAVKYSKYYEGSYVMTSMLNKRVFVLGPAPLGAKVIPLVNENTNLIEVLTIYGGIPDNGKSYNIRVIRGDLRNPNVNIVDLSTIEGMKRANLNVEPNDIIYVEPVRKMVLEAIRDVAPFMSMIISISSITLTIVLLATGKK